MFCYDIKLSGKANKDTNISHLGELAFRSWLSEGVTCSQSVQY